MTVNPHESELQFVQRAEALPELLGPYNELTKPLIETVEASPDALQQIPSANGGDRSVTSQVTFKYDQKNDGNLVVPVGGKQAKALLTRTVEGLGAFDEQRVHYELLFDDDIATHEMFSFGVSKDGHIVGNSEEASAFLATDKGSQLITVAITKLTTSIAHRQAAITNEREWEVRQRREQRRTVIRRTAVTVGGLATAAALTVGGISGYDHFVVKPREEQARAERVYDAAHHILPGKSLEFSKVTVAEMPKSDFDEIPNYSDGDDLSSPRTIGIEGNTCKTLNKVKPAEGQRLFTAVAKNSPIANSLVTATTNEGGHLRICLDGPSTGEDNKELAIQLLASASDVE